MLGERETETEREIERDRKNKEREAWKEVQRDNVKKRESE